MPILNIPDEALTDLKKIAGLDDVLFDSFMRAVKEAGPCLRPSQLISKVQEKLKFPDDGDLRSILNTVFNIWSIRASSESSSKELAEVVSKSAAERKPADFDLEKRARLQHRLTVLLDCEIPLGVTVKALDVMTAHEHTFCRARILSDIRPVFVGTLEASAAGVIIHNLQIRFHEGRRHGDFYVALDTDDLVQLKNVIERAERKAVALQTMLNKATVPYLKP
jgi:hypothetical protein